MLLYFAHLTSGIFNNRIVISVFTAALKLADLNPVFKKDLKIPKETFKTVGVKSNVSKTLEYILIQHISSLLHNYLSYKKQRIRINTSYSSWEKLYGVPMR